MVPPHPHRMRLPDRCLGTCYCFCAVLLGMCFEKMRTNLVSLLDVWSNCADAIASISSRCASNSAGNSRAAPLQRPAKSPSAALLIWHCTICSPFLIVNLYAIKSPSYPMASPRVSGMNPVPLEPLKRTARWGRQRRKMANGPNVNDFNDRRFTGNPPVFWSPCPPHAPAEPR